MNDYEYFVDVYVFLIFVNSSKILVITYYCTILSYCLFIVVVFNYFWYIQVELLLYLIIMNKLELELENGDIKICLKATDVVKIQNGGQKL